MSRISDFLTAAGISGQAAVTSVLGAAGEAISAGDLVNVAADNLAYWAADPNGTGVAKNWRPLNQVNSADAVPQGSIALVNQTGTTGITGQGTYQARDMALLTNGNIVKVWNAISGVPTYANTFAIYTPGGAVVVPPTVIEATTGVSPINVVALNGGGFAVVIINAAGTLCKICTYDGAGNLLGSYTTADAAPTNGFQQIALSNGSAVTAFQIGSGATKFYITSATGTLVSGPTTFGISNQIVPALAALVNGGFVVYSATTLSATATPTSFGVFSNTGAVVKAATNTITASGAGYLNAVALTGGGFILTTNDTVSTAAGLSAAVFDQAGTQQGATLALETGSNGNAVNWVCATSDGNAMVLWTGPSATPKLAKIGPNGAQIGATNSALSLNGASTSGQAGTLVGTPDGGALFAISFAGSVLVAPFTSALAQTSGPYTIAAQNTVYMVNLIPFAAGVNAPTTTFALSTYCNGNYIYLQLYAYRIQKQAFVGVATQNAAKGAPVQIQITGAYAMRLTFNQPYSATTPAGQKLTVIGNAAMMAGPLSASARAIN